MTNPSLSTALMVEDESWITLSAAFKNVLVFLERTRMAGTVGVACEIVPALEIESSDALGARSLKAPTLRIGRAVKAASLEPGMNAAAPATSSVGEASGDETAATGRSLPDSNKIVEERLNSDPISELAAECAERFAVNKKTTL